MPEIPSDGSRPSAAESVENFYNSGVMALIDPGNSLLTRDLRRWHGHCLPNGLDGGIRLAKRTRDLRPDLWANVDSDGDVRMISASRILSATFGVVLLTALGAGDAKAAAQLVTVDARSGPWDFSDALNAALKYGNPGAKDFLAPATVSLSSLGLSPGDGFSIQFIDGKTNAFGDTPNVDNLGHVGTTFKDDAVGSSGFNLPSLYLPNQWGANQRAQQDLNPPVDPNDVIDPDQSGVFLNALLFAVIDNDGQIIFVASMGTTTVTPNSFGGTGGVGFNIPADAVAVTFGFNDDIFADNTGALRICVGSSADLDSANPCGSLLDVPEPASLALLGSAIVGLCFLRRRRIG